MEKIDSMEALPQQSQPEPAPLVHKLYEQLTETWQYVVADPVSRHAVIIDPHLDNGPSVTNISTIAADRVLSVIRQNSYIVDRILHTHEPVRHPTSAWYLRTQLLEATGHAPQVQIGRKLQAIQNLQAMQRVFKRKSSMNDDSTWKTDFFEDKYVDGYVFQIGNISCRVVHLLRGGLAFVIGDHIFAGTSTFEFEMRTRHTHLVGNLKEYQVYGSRDQPPPPSRQKMQLAPIYEKDEKGKGTARKLAIRYTAEEVLGGK
ncbi:Hypothetical predicted protein [Lecanosticta acicola]|uniref:Metallo-beta-lactamase domain-containing protein n=1 Tax=Lecanosticta acicola TaxID=111012 RepID=A0AAI9EAT1_9PEZI|nr:Hypothetical predicted protein [Lecanosticta acicola]